MLVVKDSAALEAAVAAGADDIAVSGRIEGLPSLRLVPGRSLSGTDASAALAFAPGAEGVRLTADNALSSLRLETGDPAARAVFNDTSVPDLGILALSDVATVGRVEIVARDAVRAGHVAVSRLDVEAADAREALPRPYAYNVHARLGAFTLRNRQPDPDVVITAELIGVSAGREGAPVRGSGVLVAGGDADGDRAGEEGRGEGGRLEITRLTTGPVFTDGGIPEGTAGEITGGVFVAAGAYVHEVVNDGPVTTYGVNDMVLDLWGEAGTWTARAPLTSYGPSGIGFVHFGTLRRLDVAAPIETFGRGARGFNVYEGTIETAEFDRIVTHADAAVGVQIGRPCGELVVRRGIETYGAEGDSLVKGALVRLAANALSLKPGGHVRRVRVDGGLVTHGEGVAALDLVHGRIDELTVTGGVRSTGGSGR
ncbi:MULTISPECIES: hypothetical protein [Actinomadura]|uniref:Uncharacterized protein n=1 Tax=Actinomadura yumaensis TaxID=111807 RepID=A0ABW2CHG4_9ACTN|nr:hypothetical protein [Actinomadura sp. J1-007]MWK34920.1 hypothetical protein [Actinomadura sp. J1-007]